jgi:hypothetical protein
LPFVEVVRGNSFRTIESELLVTKKTFTSAINSEQFEQAHGGAFWMVRDMSLSAQAKVCAQEHKFLSGQ